LRAVNNISKRKVTKLKMSLKKNVVGIPKSVESDSHFFLLLVPPYLRLSVQIQIAMLRPSSLLVRRFCNVRSTAASGSTVYESARAVDEYLQFHYGVLDFCVVS
jgi:hypothetical protein